ncbi:HTH domain-containing protein [Clostridium sp. D2Q-11]|uniref:HTH domain-containing protein n=1 Tax=Anaeromonas frigoriresistens TaxID=2683708 RepID=A0A942UUG9_9FIRM|nr:HTH domain-containing protein [Anaeromonas frigoriresistens]MBS4538230.1 HTH domain-containing protein [Anaeromonas frigoriresistens]
MLTKKQLVVLKGIDDLIKENKYSPTVREIGEKVGLKSSSSVHTYIKKLEEKGCLSKVEASGRSLVITERGQMALKLINN